MDKAGIIISSLAFNLLAWQPRGAGSIMARGFLFSPRYKSHHDSGRIPIWFRGILIEDGCVVSWFASELTHHDEAIHKQSRGEAEGQQNWEALCVLVAVRCWATRWLDKRVSITMKSDNMAALSLAARLKSKVSSLIAKETALVYSSASFQPRYVEHIPGVLNYSADALSRLTDPSGGYEVPPYLPSQLRVQLPVRAHGYYRTLTRHGR